jgi:gluconolactonase
MTDKSMAAKPFHVYDREFLELIGHDPRLTVIGGSNQVHGDSGNELPFHEAVVWYPPTDEVFWVQGANAGTGSIKSALIGKMELSEAMAVSHKRNATGDVDFTFLNATTRPTIINPNGRLFSATQLMNRSSHRSVLRLIS